MPKPENNPIYLPLVGNNSSSGGPGIKNTPTPRPSPTPTKTPRPSPTPKSSPTPTSTSNPTTFVPAIYIDLKRCIGCNACSLACKQENGVQIGERWNEVYGTENGTYPTVDIRVLPMFCHHCDNAPCKKKCDEMGHHAIVQRTDGIVYVDPVKCTGCKKCIPECPYKAMFFNTQKNKAEKCHFCMHRIDAGLAPACVITCLGITREFGDFNELKLKYPSAKAMGDKVKILYGNLGEEPEYSRGDTSTNGYPDPIPCHD